MHSGVAGSSSAFVAAQHLKDRIQTSYLDMVTLDALVTPPINKVCSLVHRSGAETHALPPFI